MEDELSEHQKTLNRLFEEETNYLKADAQAERLSALDPSLNLDVIRRTNDLFDAERETQYLQNESNIYGELSGLFGEIGFGLVGSSLNTKAAPLIPKMIKGVKGVRNLSRLSLMSPEAGSKFGTIPMWLLSEAFVWGTANAAGQWIRSSFSDHNFSIGELGASTLFGMGAAPVMSKAETAFSAIGRTAAEKKAIKLSGLTLDEMGIFKQMPLKRKLAERYGVPFITGAAFGIGETALRESLEMQMNERDNRSTWEYLMLTGVIGGSANGLFKALGATKWGRNQVAVAADDALESSKKKLEDAQAKLDKLKSTKEPKRERQKRWLMDQKKLAQQELQDLKGAVAFLEETSSTIKKNNDHMLSMEEAPAMNIEQMKQAGSVDRAAPAPKDRSDFGQDIDELVQDAGNDIVERANKIQEQDWAEGVATLKDTDVSIAARARDLNEKIELEISEYNRIYSGGLADGAIDEEAGRKLLNLISDKIELDTKVLDPYKILFGRGLKSLREGEDLYKLQRATGNSTRAQKSQDSWINLRDELKKNLDEKTPFHGITKQIDDIGIAIKNINKKGKEASEAAKRLRKSKKTYDPAKLVDQEIKRLEKQIQKETDKTKAPDTALDVKKPKAEQTEEIKELKRQLAVQKKLARDAMKYAELQRELDSLLGMSPQDFLKLSKEKQAQKALKKQGPKTKADDLRDEIKAKLKELRKAAKALERREALAKHKKFFDDLTDAYVANIWKSKSHLIYRTASRWTTLRQLALIDQLPSVMAGTYSGAFLGIKNAVARPIATSFRQGVKTVAPAKILKWVGSEKSDWDTTKQLVLNEWLSAAELFKELSTAFKAAKQRAKTLENVTDQDPTNKLNLNEKEVNLSSYANTVTKSSQSSRAIAERKSRLTEAIDLSGSASLRQFVNVLSLGYRGIVAVDEVFYRQNVKANIHRAAGTKAILEAPNDPKLQAKIKEKFIEDSWEKRSTGISVLRETDDNFAAINSTRQDMFYSLNTPKNGTIHDTLSQTIIDGFKGLGDRNKAIKLISAAYMPFVNIAVRSVALSAKLTTAPIGYVFGKANMSPVKAQYDKAIEEAQEAIDKYIAQKSKATSKAEKDELQKEILEQEREIDLNKARRVEYEADYASYALMGGAAFAFAYRGALSDESLITGSLSWMTEDQRKNAELQGIVPYTMKTPFGLFDLRKAMPFGLPLVLGADYGAYTKAKENGELLEENQNLPAFLATVTTNFVREIPFNQGLKDLSDLLTSGKEETVRNAIIDLGSSYGLVPAQAKKLAKLYTGEEKVDDLKGGTWFDRTMYQTFGIATPNKKVDIFGDFAKSSKNFFTETIQVVPLSDTISDFEEYRELAALDWTGTLPTKLPETITTGINMYDFIDSEGVTLHSIFGKRLREDGSIKNRVRKIITNPSFRRLLRDGEALAITGKNNEKIYPAFNKVKKIIEGSWDVQKKKLMKEILTGDLGDELINEEGQTIKEVLQEAREQVGQKDWVKLLNLKDF